jgi:hypothetical protein
MRKLILLQLSLATLVSTLSGEVFGARSINAGSNKAAASAPAGNTGAGSALSTVPVTVSRRFVEWDGFTISKLVLAFDRAAAVELSQQRMGDWQRRDQAPFAIAFYHPMAPDARLGINCFTGSAASSLLAGNAWTSTPSSLPRNPRDVSRVLVNDDSAANSNMLRPLSWRTRVFEREITPAEPGTPPQRQVLVAIGDATQAYLFTLEGSASQVAGLKESFERLVTSFELVN